MIKFIFWTVYLALWRMDVDPSKPGDRENRRPLVVVSQALGDGGLIKVTGMGTGQGGPMRERRWKY